MPPEDPFDWEQVTDEELDSYDVDHLNQSWVSGDQEWYPIWPTTLFEQDQIWRTRFNLRTSNERVERLAQEAKLFVLINDIAHES